MTSRDNKEYTSLVNEIYKDDRIDLYQALMGREDRVLGIVDRVATQERDRTSAKKQFLSASLLDMCSNASDALSGIFTDLVKAKTYSDVVTGFSINNRRLYVGMLLIVVAMFLLMIKQ